MTLYFVDETVSSSTIALAHFVCIIGSKASIVSNFVKSSAIASLLLSFEFGAYISIVIINIQEYTVIYIYGREERYSINFFAATVTASEFFDFIAFTISFSISCGYAILEVLIVFFNEE